MSPTRRACAASTAKRVASRATVAVRRSATPVVALQQFVQHAMAQRALGDLHLLDVEQVEHRAQHADAAADHRPCGLRACRRCAASVGAAGLQQAVEQPVEAVAGDHARPVAGRGQHVADRADGAGGAVGHVPAGRGT